MIVHDGTTAENADFTILRAPALLVQNGLAGAEVIAVQVYNGIGYQAAVDDAGTAIKLTATQTNVVLTAGGKFRLVCPVTAGRCVVTFQQNAT